MQISMTYTATVFAFFVQFFLRHIMINLKYQMKIRSKPVFSK